MATKTSKTQKGVRLSLGGAPDTWHQIPGIGLVHPTIARPITDDEEAFARKADCLTVVALTDAQAATATAQYDDARGASSSAVRDARKQGSANEAEAEQISDEAAASAKEIG